MFCFWCVWGRPSIKDNQGANGNSFSAAEAPELDHQLNQSVNLSSCQPKTTAPVTYKPLGRQDASLTKPSKITATSKIMAKNNIETGLSPTSSSCPQLTVEEPTESCSEEETEHSHVRVHEARKPFKSASSKQVKTYSFRRMLSFRGSLRGSGARNSNSTTATEGSPSSSPGLQPHHRPLQFSFLGQIYKTRSTKKQQEKRRSSSQKVRQHTPPALSHLHPSIDDLNADIDDTNMTSATQAIVEN